MGKTHRYLILILLMTGCSAIRVHAAEKTFQEVDQQSLALYEKGEWKELVKYSDQVIQEGFDYYYLRMRAGIANFMIRHYMKAVLHFKKALVFNDKDPVAEKYLYSCYLELNRSADARRIFDDLPSSDREDLGKTLLKLHQVIIETGPLFSNQPSNFSKLDLDGEENIYGEADITGNGYYFNSGLSWDFIKGYGIYGGYSLVRLEKNKQVKIGDSLFVNDKYPLVQHQFYLNGNIPLGKGFSVLPAMNVIMDRYETVMPQFDSNTFIYSFPVVKTRLNSYIAYLSITKDFQIVRTSIFGAYSNLNSREQIQAGFCILAFPFGNLNFYLSSKLMNHRNDGQNNIIFEQMVGARLFKPLWSEITATFGQMENYHENNAFVVYNIADKMSFKAGAKLMYALNPRWMITANYIYLMREGEYISYSVTPPPEPPKAIPVTLQQGFHNQFVLLGLKWSF
jgi:tetratricopeptide (TPR) repeat protein